MCIRENPCRSYRRRFYIREYSKRFSPPVGRWRTEDGNYNRLDVLAKAETPYSVEI